MYLSSEAREHLFGRTILCAVLGKLVVQVPRLGDRLQELGVDVEQSHRALGHLRRAVHVRGEEGVAQVDQLALKNKIKYLLQFGPGVL